MSNLLRKRLEIGFFAGPALIFYVGLVILPIVLAAFYSVFRWDGLGPLVDPTCIEAYACLLYTSPSPRDRQKSRMPSSA